MKIEIERQDDRYYKVQCEGLTGTLSADETLYAVAKILIDGPKSCPNYLKPKIPDLLEAAEEFLNNPTEPAAINNMRAAIVEAKKDAEIPF